MSVDLAKAKVGDTVVFINYAKATIYDILKTPADHIRITYEEAPFMDFVYHTDGSAIHSNTRKIMKIESKVGVDKGAYSFLTTQVGGIKATSMFFNTEKAVAEYVKKEQLDGALIIKIIGCCKEKTIREFTYVKY